MDQYAFAVLLFYKFQHTCETNMIPYSDHHRWDTAIAIAEMCTLRNTLANFSIATAASSMESLKVHQLRTAMHHHP
jgi:hypothetical protein